MIPVYNYFNTAVDWSAGPKIDIKKGAGAKIIEYHATTVIASSILWI